MVRPVIVIAIVIATFENGRLSSACVEYDHVPWPMAERRGWSEVGERNPSSPYHGPKQAATRTDLE